MIFKVFGVLQFILIQVISAQVSNRDLSRQNALNNLANTPLAECGRSRRQINNPPVGLPRNGNLAANGFAFDMPFKNSLPNGNFLRGNGLPNNFALKNGLANNFALNNVLPNNFPFPNLDIIPQNRLLPSFNGVISNGLPFSNVPNGLPSLNNGLPGLNNVPSGLPSLNNGLPGLNNVPSGLPSLNNGLPGLNNVPSGLPSLNNGLPGLNNVPSGLPSLNNGLPGLNNVPSGLPSLNYGLPGLNNVPSGLPSLNNGLPGLNNVPSGLPSLNNELPGLNNVPSGSPSYNNGWPSLINVPNVLPGLNNVPNLNKNPTFTNKVLNLNHVPAGIDILNLNNNLPAKNTLPNINNIAIPNALPSFKSMPCNSLPRSKGLPLNNLPSGNILPPINNQLPYFNNFRITEIGIGNGVADIKRFPRANLPVDNMAPNANNLQNVNELRQVSDELTNMNGFLSIVNMPSASTLPNILPVDNRFSNVNHFPISSGISNIANDVQNNNNMQLNNGLPDDCHFQNYNAMPVNEQRFVSNVPFNNDFAVLNNFPANTGMPNTNSRTVNAIDNGMLLSNGGHLNDILLDKRGFTEKYSENSDGSGRSSNDYQFGNIQMPLHNWHYDLVPSKMPANQDLLLTEGVQMFSNVPNDYSSVLTSNNLNFVKNLQTEGLANMPFLNGLPVAGITETVTLLNDPHSK